MMKGVNADVPGNTLFVDDCDNGCWIVTCSVCEHEYHSRQFATPEDKCPCCGASNLYPEGASW